MTDQLVKIVQTKMTQKEKRGDARNSREYMNDRRNLEPVRVRAEAELAVAQSRLAELALDKENPAEWLSDVLSALGLHRVISAS
jgi:hypothetical protein